MYQRFRIMPQPNDQWLIFRQPKGVAWEPHRPHPHDVHVATAYVSDVQCHVECTPECTPDECNTIDDGICESIQDRLGWGNNTPEPFIYEVDT